MPGADSVDDLRIVLVEDDAQIGALLAELLVALGHEVCAIAATEGEAVAAAASHDPDLMLVDVHLHTGNGLSTMNTILARMTMPHVFMTCGARGIFPVGATVLLKPFSKRNLTEAMDRVVKQGCSHEPE